MGRPRCSGTFRLMVTENFLRLMGRLLKLTREGFKGKVTINFDGSGPKDLIEQKYTTLDQVEVDLEAIEEIWRRTHP